MHPHPHVTPRLCVCISWWLSMHSCPSCSLWPLGDLSTEHFEDEWCELIGVLRLEGQRAVLLWVLLTQAAQLRQLLDHLGVMQTATVVHSDVRLEDLRQALLQNLHTLVILHASAVCNTHTAQFSISDSLYTTFVWPITQNKLLRCHGSTIGNFPNTPSWRKMIVVLQRFRNKNWINSALHLNESLLVLKQLFKCITIKTFYPNSMWE